MFRPMIRWFAVLLAALAIGLITTVIAQEDASLPEADESLEIEPPLLIHSRDQHGLPVVPTPTPRADIAKIEKDLGRAQRAATAAQKLLKAGIISQVEAEERALRVVRLEARLAAARLDEAKNRVTEEQNAAEIVQAEEDAKRRSEERHRLEIENAVRNLWRQQKLLALGSGRKADVSRAEKRLAELQAAAPAELK